MRNRRPLLAVPYVVWMALFVVAPIIMVVVYAFTSAGATAAEIGEFTAGNFTGMGTYLPIFTRSWLSQERSFPPLCPAVFWVAICTHSCTSSFSTGMFGFGARLAAHSVKSSSGLGSNTLHRLLSFHQIIFYVVH